MGRHRGFAGQARHGAKAKLMAARLKFLRDNPGAAKLLADGKRPKGYPMGPRDA